MFVIAIRMAHKLFGGFEIPFRAVPFAFSVASVVLALFLGKRLLGPIFGPFLGAVIAVSPALIRLSLELKQYSSDVCCAVLLMILIWDYLQRPDWRTYTRLLIASLVTLPLAYTTVMFLPLAAIVILAADRDRKTKAIRIAIFILLTSAVFLTLLFVFIKPNESPELVAYWYLQKTFPPKGGGNFRFYLDGFKSALHIPWSRFLSWLFALLAIGGLASLLWSIRKGRSKALLAFTCLPILTLLVLNRLFLYPFYAEKQDIFTFPCLPMLALCGVTTMTGFLTRHIRQRAIVEAASLLACAAFTLTALLMDFRKPPRFSSEDPASAVRYLKLTNRPGDLVYVHASAEEQIKLYLRLFDVQGLTVVFGNTGWACCTRHHQFETGMVDDSYVIRDLQNHMSETRSGRVLLVFSDRIQHWEWLGRDERQIILRHASDLSCQRIGTHPAGTIVIDDLRCGGHLLVGLYGLPTGEPSNAGGRSVATGISRFSLDAEVYRRWVQRARCVIPSEVEGLASLARER